MLANRMVGLPDRVRLSATTTSTAEDGMAMLEMATAEPILIVGRGPGSAPSGLVVNDFDEPIVLDLPPEQFVHGSIWNWPEQTRLPGATVRAQRAFQEEKVFADSYDPIERVAGMFFWSETLSDAGSLYRLGGLPRGRVLVIASTPERASTCAFDKILPTEEPVPLSLVVGRMVSGTVIDAETREPLEGVRVATSSKATGFTQWEAGFELTDEHGRFDLSAPLEEGKQPAIRATLDGYGEAAELLPTDGDRPVVIALHEVTPVHVHVRESDGTAVAARVQAFASESRLFLTSMRADERGLAELSLDGTRTYSLLATSEDHEQRFVHDVRFDRGPVEIVLDRLGGIRGTVTAAGAPVARAVVRARQERGEGRWRSDARVETAEDGSFTLPRLAHGDYVVDAWPPDDAPGLAHGRVELFVDVGQTQDVSIEIPASLTVAGCVRSAITGEPIAGATVTVADLFRFGVVSGGLPGETTTDAEGRFVLTGVPPNRATLYVEHESYVAVARELDGRADASALDIRIHPPGSLEVVLPRTDPDRAVTFVVRVSSDEGRTQLVQTTEPTVLFDRLPPGAVSVVALPHGATWKGRAVQRTFAARTELRAGEHRRVVLPSAGTATIRGKVELPPSSGLDPAELYVIVHAPDESPISGLNGATVKADGMFEFPMAPTGKVIARLHAGGGGADGAASITNAVRLTLFEGEERVLNFRPSVCGVSGTVTDPTGRGVRCTLRIRGRGNPPGPWATIRTDDDGRFRHFREPGPIEWTAGAEGFGAVVGTSNISDASTWLEERIVLRPEARLLVHVEDVSGEPVHDAHLRASPDALPDADDASRQRDWGAGRWQLRRLGAGLYTLEVSAPGFVTHRESLTLGAGARRTTRVRLRRAVDLELFVLSNSGQPLSAEAVRFELLSEERSTAWEGRTDGSGRIVVRIPEGPYELVVKDEREALDLTGMSGPIRAELRLD